MIYRQIPPAPMTTQVLGRVLLTLLLRQGFGLLGLGGTSVGKAWEGQIVSYHSILCYIILYHIILCYIVLYYIILYYTISKHTLYTKEKAILVGICLRKILGTSWDKPMASSPKFITDGPSRDVDRWTTADFHQAISRF